MSHEVLRLSEEFYAAHQRAVSQTARERDWMQRSERAWDTYNSSPAEYEKTFKPLLAESFYDFATRRRAQTGRFFVLDVMGTTSFMDSGLGIPVDGEVGMTLFDFRNIKGHLEDNRRRRKIIPGEILELHQWTEAKKIIREWDDREFPGFDLILCRPIGGWNTIRESKYSTNPLHDIFETFIPQRSANLLSTNGGMLLTQMATGGDYTNWIGDLQQVEGIHTIGQKNKIRIVRESSGRIILPKISGVIRPLPEVSPWANAA